GYLKSISTTKEYPKSEESLLGGCPEKCNWAYTVKNIAVADQEAFSLKSEARAATLLASVALRAGPVRAL
ncbi:MAG: hypothetical protein AAFR59_07535, partial [Bacteroidota bacterium]